MPTTARHGGLDWFKLIAAGLVVAIHTSPLTTYSGTADFLLTRVLARVAVPFFFMVTGHFVLGGWLFGEKKPGAIWRYCKKLLLLYALAILLYLPLGLYAGHYQGLTALSALRLLLFDGTFYHLWYFPGCLMGLGLLSLLGRKFSPRALAVWVSVLYGIGLLGDSWYGLAAQIPPLSALYELGFHLFSYTRNGLFLAPLFLYMGAWLGSRPSSRWPGGFGVYLIPALLLMTEEALLLRELDYPRHDSMYILLPLVMFLLYRLLLAWTVPAPALLQTLPTVVYLLHPAMIVAVRMLARPLGLTALLVENSLGHYLAVCTLSALTAGAVSLFLLRRRQPSS